jgi:pyrroline-5-carboxylate reductase
VSGSGPAYVFLFAECMEDAARSLGLSPALARQLVSATLTGSSRLAAQSSDDPSVLRARVTSRGGTTQAAMDVFTAAKIEQIYKRALGAAARRSRELRR